MLKRLFKLAAIFNQKTFRSFLFVAIPSILLLLLIAIVLLGFIHYESNSYYRMQQEIAKNAVRSAVHNLSQLVEKRRQIVMSIARQEKELLLKIVDFPADQDNLSSLTELLKNYFPDYFSYQFADAEGTPMVLEKSIKVGATCHAGLKLFADTPENYSSTLVIHGSHPEDYHFDIMVDITRAEDSPIFFVSFKLDAILQMLRNLTIPGQSIVIVRDEDLQQVEMSAEGVFSNIWKLKRLSKAHLNSVLHSEKVPGTGWQLLAIPDDDMLASYKSGLYVRSAIAYVILCVIFFNFIWRLWKNENSRLETELKLKHSNDALEMKVQRRTRALAKSQRDLEKTFMSAPYGMLVINSTGIIESINKRAEEIFGYASNELLNQSIDILIPEQYRKYQIRYQDSFKQIKRKKKSRLAGKGRHLRALKKSGEELAVEMEISALRHSDGDKIIVSITDVSALVATRQKLLDEHERALVTLRAIADGVITTDIQGVVSSINPVAEKLTGWEANEAIGRHITEVFQTLNEKTGEKVSDSVIQCLEQGAIVELGADKVIMHRNGMQIPVEDSAAPIHSSKGEIIGAVLVFHDVSQSRAHAHEVEYQANHDELTGLLNRREFDARLSKSIDKAKEKDSQNILLFMDLDRFKLVNDTAGHAAGDELLKQITKLMSGMLRQRDTFARLGGDEFAILLEHCSEKVGLKLANKIRVAVEDFRFFWNSQVFNIGVSIGMVPFSGSAKSADNILSEADAACYTAKESGRNRVQVYDVTSAQKRGESSIINLLVEAFENCRMQLYQQPIIATDTAVKQSHYEILVRMLSAKGDVISPGMFLPAAERYGLATTLDRWVVKSCFAWLAQHQSSFKHDFVFAINLSGQSITDLQFSLFIKQQFEDYRINKSSICFEITETSAMKDLEKARAFINDLKHLGCLFSLDDFGSGHASYAHLKNLPVNFLKIDGMFVKDIEHDPIDFSIVKSMNEVGQVLGMKTIAEYVENDAIKQKLIDIGVDFLQGYGVARPAPLDDLLNQLDESEELQQEDASKIRAELISSKKSAPAINFI